MLKKYLNINVLEAAQKRISYIFDNFEKIYISFSGGKDSSVMTHLILEEAMKRKKIIGLLFIDLEGQYKLTIDHIKKIIDIYKENIKLFWICLPLSLRNAVSVYEPKWVCWNDEEKEKWVRKLPTEAIHDMKYFDFFKFGMEFEDFVVEFGKWYGGTQKTACFVGIRSDESLNRFRTIKLQSKITYKEKQWTTRIIDNIYNVYPIYDWRTRDIWIYNWKFKKEYNKLYDLMNQAGLSIHQQRICQPYGDDQRRGLWLFHIIEPETWSKIVSRVNGANSGALYSKESGNINGTIKIKKPEGHTWKSFSQLLLNSMPEKIKEHYKIKIDIFLSWWWGRGWYDIPDEHDPKLENSKKVPSWRRIAKALLRNDYWCKGLSFSQHKDQDSYIKFLRRMKKRKNKNLWMK